MLTVPAVKIQQFRLEFYLLNLSATDVQRLVRFEVLGEAGLDGAHRAAYRARPSTVNWVEIVRRGLRDRDCAGAARAIGPRARR